jgi:epoxyqueuosine reductase
MKITKPHPLLNEHLLKSGIEWSSVLNIDSWMAFWEQNQTPPELHDDIEALQKWLEKGHNADMTYLAKNMHARQNPRHLLSNVCSILSVVIPYATSGVSAARQRTSASQKIELSEQSKMLDKTARYARVVDYHKAIKKELNKAIEQWQTTALEAKIIQAPVSWRVVTDALPFLDRAHARLAQLGFIGKNTMLIRPGIGSYFFIAHVLLSADFSSVSDPHEVKPLAADAITQLSCGDCTRCMDACPTQAIIAPRHLNAQRCLSYLTIEHRGLVDPSWIPHFAEHFYGCDVCQDVCPYNFRISALKTIAAFKENHSSLESLTIEDVASMTQLQYEQWFGGTAMTRAKYAGLVRNALYSLHASHHPQLNAVLLQRQQDPHPLIQATVSQLLELEKQKSV